MAIKNKKIKKKNPPVRKAKYTNPIVNNGWTYAKSQLPEVDTEYLIILRNGELTVGKYLEERKLWKTQRGVASKRGTWYRLPFERPEMTKEEAVEIAKQRPRDKIKIQNKEENNQ